ncbi:hypothetical protein GCM10009721_38650 [Terrabacter tumescens]|uniref:Tripartite tricarboxylate transporter TctB family protein n=1 Tax=Terrabacter tumescens TaxID=60443 RepID=A0ABQ2IFW1_9MICO|nr:hypothetical protein [Terrabacter tumescens]GGN07187.1 hypothetical protein GCM10009721_38650 [Terrabacter tumescens]
MSTVERRHHAPRQAPRQPGLRTESRAAIGLGIAGFLVAGATFVTPKGEVAGACWTVGFALFFGALVMAVVGIVHARGDRLSALPTSAAGWVALLCFIAGAALLFGPFAEFSLALALVSAGAAVLGVGALRERSLAVIALPLLGGTFVLAFLLGELLIGHE